MHESSREFFETLAKLLFRCWVFSFLILFIWFGSVLLAGDFVYSLHSQIFNLTENQMNMVHYCGMGLLKLVAITGFFLPWLAIKMGFPAIKSA